MENTSEKAINPMEDGSFRKRKLRYEKTAERNIRIEIM